MLLRDFIKNIFKTGLHSDLYEQISFKFGVMLDTTKLYTFVIFWMTLTFT